MTATRSCAFDSSLVPPGKPLHSSLFIGHPPCLKKKNELSLTTTQKRATNSKERRAAQLDFVHPGPIPRTAWIPGQTTRQDNETTRQNLCSSVGYPGVGVYECVSKIGKPSNRRFSFCFRVVSLWFPCGFPLVSLWCPFGFPLVSLSTRNRSTINKKYHSSCLGM